MKVNQSGSVWRPYAYSQQPPLSTGQGRRAKGEDQVEISAQAKAMLQKEAVSSRESKETSLSKEERIEQLKQQIANGTYQVDAHKVAERLYNFSVSGLKE